MIFLGGVGSVYGPIAAAFLLTIFSEFLTGAGAYRPMIIALLIIGVMLTVPGGLIAALNAGIGRRRAVEAGCIGNGIEIKDGKLER